MMIKHAHDKNNPVSTLKRKVLDNWKRRWKTDGLNSLNTTISGVVKFRTHLKIKVRTNRNTRFVCKNKKCP